MTQTNEWDDPYPIIEEEADSTLEDRIEQAVAEAYAKEHTTTPLDKGAHFTVQSIDEVSGEPDTYKFRARRFLGQRPSGVYTGVAREQGDEWEITFDDSALVAFVKRLRDYMPA